MKKWRTLRIQEGTEASKFLFEGKTNKTKHELIEELVKAIPQSKQDRAYKSFCTFKEELALLFPESNGNLELLWPLMAKRILKIRDIDGKEQYLDEIYYSQLKEI